MLRWAIVLALVIVVLLGLAIFLCLRKRNRALRQNSSRVEEEEGGKPKTKDVEQTYSLVEERWNVLFVAFKHLQICIYQQWPNILYLIIAGMIKKKQIPIDFYFGMGSLVASSWIMERSGKKGKAGNPVIDRQKKQARPIFSSSK